MLVKCWIYFQLDFVISFPCYFFMVISVFDKVSELRGTTFSIGLTRMRYFNRPDRCVVTVEHVGYSF
jgi:hypothetical protein